MTNCVLVVEDEPDVRETIKEILQMEGFTVVTAENGQDALNVLTEFGKPCLILLDLMMPVMNGWQFLEALKNGHQQLFASTPIVVVSAVADLTTVQAQYNCRVMKKPANVQSLLALAHEYCKAS